MKKYTLIFAIVLIISALLLSSATAFANDNDNIDYNGSQIESLPSFVFYIPGDVDGNCTVDINDVTYYQLVLVGKQSETECFLKNAETYTDQVRNIRDVTVIQIYLAGIYKRLPVTPDGYYAQLIRP